MNNEVRIIIAGTRTLNDYKKVEKAIHKILAQLTKEGILTGNIKEDIKNIIIVSGGAKGADSLGERFADKYNTNKKLFPAKWDDLEAKPCMIRCRQDGSKYNVLAGVNRNSEMANYVSEVDNGMLIAFWNGRSTGTKNMIELANKKKLRVFIENI